MELILTNAGLAKLASATPEDQLEISDVAAGDGNGGYPPLDPTMTDLVNEVWRGSSSAPIRDPNSNRILIFEGVIPANVGGFTIREVGLFDVEGDMIAIGQVDEIDKPSGAGVTPITLTLRVRLVLENAAQTDLIIADAPYVDHQGTANRDAPDAHPITAITGLAQALADRPTTSSLGSVAFRDEVHSDDDTYYGRIPNAGWLGINMSRRWVCGVTAQTNAWCRFMRLRVGPGSLAGRYGEARIAGISNTLSNARPPAVRVIFGPIQGTPRASVYALISPGQSGIGDVAINEVTESGDEYLDLYVRVGYGADTLCEVLSDRLELITPIFGEYSASLPSGATIAPTGYDMNTLSMAQSWQDMTSSRSLGTTYTNDTPFPIQVSVIGNQDTGATSPYLSLEIGGVPVSQSKASAQSGNTYVQVYGTVPPGAPYVVNTASATLDKATLLRWSELR